MFYVRQKASPFGDEEITQLSGRRHHSFRRWMRHEPLPYLWQAGDVENCQPAVANLSRNCVYEANPIAMLIEQAGGYASTGSERAPALLR